MGLLDPRNEARTRVFHSGTFNGNPLSISVGEATIEALRRPGKFEGLVARTGTLKRGISSALAKRGIPHHVAGEGGVFNFYLTEGQVKDYRDIKESDLRRRRFLDIEFITRGVFLKPENRFCLSLAHTNDDIRLTTERFEQSLDAVVPSAHS